MKRIFLSISAICIMAAFAYAESCTKVGEIGKKYTPEGECSYKTDTRTCCETMDWSDWNKECPKSPNPVLPVKKCKKYRVNKRVEKNYCGTVPACADDETKKRVPQQCGEAVRNSVETASRTKILGELTEEYCAYLGGSANRVFFGNVNARAKPETAKYCPSQWGGTTSKVDLEYTYDITYTSCGECVEWE